MQEVLVPQPRGVIQFPKKKKRQCADHDKPTSHHFLPSKRETKLVDQNKCANAPIKAESLRSSRELFDVSQAQELVGARISEGEASLQREALETGHVPEGEQPCSSSCHCTQSERKRPRAVNLMEENDGTSALSPPCLAFSSAPVQSSSMDRAAIRRKGVSRFLNAYKAQRAQNAQAAIDFLSNDSKEERDRQLTEFRSRVKARPRKREVDVHCHRPLPSAKGS